MIELDDAMHEDLASWEENPGQDHLVAFPATFGVGTPLRPIMEGPLSITARCDTSPTGRSARAWS